MLTTLYLAAVCTALGSPVWEEREAASGHLLRLVDRHPEYGPRLAAWARESTHPEVIARLRLPLAQWARARAAAYVPKGVPVWPCNDMTPLLVPTAAGWIAVPMRPGIASQPAPSATSGPWWHEHRARTERMARDMIRDGADEAAVDLLLQRMWSVERQLQGDCPAGWHEAAKWTKWEGGYPCPRATQ